jgi:hypothetical protein
MWWTFALLALATVLVVADVVAARDDRRTFESGQQVTGDVAADWDGSRDIPLSYRDPSTGAVVRTSTYLWDVSLRPAGPGEVAIEVSATDPMRVVIAGDRFPATANLTSYLPWVLAPAVVWLLRSWTLWRTRRLMAADGPSFAMSGRAVPPRWWGRRWRLRLYALDGDVTGSPVCAVPLVANASADMRPFVVEVKGTPRPYGRVVARDADGGDVLWPSGRALRASGRDPKPDVAAVSTATRWLTIAGAACVVIGMVVSGSQVHPEDVQARAELVDAVVERVAAQPDGGSVVTVRFDWRGADRRGDVDLPNAPAVGDLITAYVDPDDPARVWSEGAPPGTFSNPLPDVVAFAGLATLALALYLRLGARQRSPGWERGASWQDLHLRFGRLWYDGGGGPLRSPRLRFDCEALVLVDRNGQELVFAWDLYAGLPLRDVGWWRLDEEMSQTSIRGSRTLRLLAFDANGVPMSTHRISIRFGSIRSVGVVPALAQYLARTPAARAGLRDPARIAALLDDLGAGEWRRPGPPRQPLHGAALDVHVAVAAVLDRVDPRLGDRRVRGTTVPPIADLLPVVLARLAPAVRASVDDADVAATIERHLAAGRWPFDAVLPVEASAGAT